MTISPETPGKTNSQRSLLVTAAVLLLASVLGSCHALRRGDVLQQTDDTLYFSKIGFLAVDNAANGLPRDTVVNVQGHGDSIVINVPYVTDTTAPMNVYFETVGKDTKVEFENTLGFFVEIQSSGNSISFHDGGTNPRDVRFRISKIDSFSDDSNIESQEIVVRVTKTIIPVLLNPPVSGDDAPLSLGIGFEDETGSFVPMAAPAGVDGARYHWNDQRLKVITGPTFGILPVDGYYIDLRPLYPENHSLQFDTRFFTDADGYTSSAEEISFNYDPPAVHLSQNGIDTNDGLSPETPVKTWTKARQIIIDSGYSLFNIYIEASGMPYNVNGAGLINGSFTSLGVYGGFMPGFSGRYMGDWKVLPKTKLTDLSQTTGSTETTPSSVIELNNVGSDVIFDQLQINVKSDTDATTAMHITNSSAPIISNSLFGASQGSSLNSTVVTVTAGSAPIFRETRFFGKFDGSGSSIGLRIDASTTQLTNDCLIITGDFSGVNYGIRAFNNSFLNIDSTIIFSGLNQEAADTTVELQNFGIYLDNSSLNMHNGWIHVWDSSMNSSAVYSNTNAFTPATSFIKQSTLITEQSPQSTGIRFLRSSATPSNLRLFNSVVMAGKSTANPAIGVQLQDMSSVQIMGNAIHAKDGDIPSNTFGINLVGSAPSLDVRNNLIWSNSTPDFAGIVANFTASTQSIYHNDFWDTNGMADFQLNTIDGRQDLYFWQDSLASMYGNISIPVSVDLGFSYDTRDFDVGHIQGTVPVDVMYGGEDLSGIADYPYDTVVTDKRDRWWNPRTGNSGVGWSMGPYEYGSAGTLPSIIYVAENTNGGNDGHPLGTRQAPLASLARAYDLARTNALARWDVTDIHVAEGIYDLQLAGMPSIDTDIRILGGYQPGSWSRNPSVYKSELTRNAPAVLVYTSNSVSRASLLDGFTLRNTAVSGGTVGVSVLSAAAPDIEHNVIIGGDGNDSRGLEAIGSSPRIENNEISAGTAGLNATGVYLQNSNGTELRNNNIDAGAGNFTRGLHVFNTEALIEGNNIFGGIAGNTSYGAYFDGAANSLVNSNTIRGGEGTITYGVDVWSSGPLFINSNRIFGSSASPPKMETTGVRIDNAPETFLTNNIVHAGNQVTSNSRGIRIQDGTDKVYLYNNTVFGGRSTGTSSMVINTIGTAAPHLINNILVAGTSLPAVDTSVFEQSGLFKPARFLNNLLLSINIAAIPYTEGGNDWMDESEIDLYLTGGIPDPNYRDYRVSIAEDPSAYFVNFIPGLNEAAFMGENWRLSGGGAVNARYIGVNLSSDTWYPFNRDRDGKTRTTPWSIGAYEY